MIATFPDPYPGELLFSVLARFSGRMAYPAEYAANLELFGARHGTPAVELPNRIDRLVSALPPGALYTSDSIIQNNTLFPLYAPFLPDQNRELIIANMKGDGTRTTQLRSGIIAGRVPSPTFFRTCPACDRENTERYGETYWNRLHQVSGVEICPVHSVFLENTNVQLRGSDRGDALISAESAQRAVVVRKVDPDKPDIMVLLRVAQSAAWLLDKNTVRPGLIEIKRGYRRVLDQRGIISPRGWIRRGRLRRRIAECCTPELLQRFGCEMRAAGDGGWLARVFRETDQTTAPLRHLLILAVLNISAEAFFTRVLAESTTHRPTTVYPCLNPICMQFQKPVITNFEFKRAEHGFARIFECPHCGHRSSRAADGGSVIRVVKFGELWERMLTRHWGNTSLSVKDIATKLNAQTTSVLTYAVKLGLAFPRRGPRKMTNQPRCLRVAKRLPPAMLIREKQAAWHQLRNQNPLASISELHRLAPAVYTWLYRHDRQWLDKNSPAHRPLVPRENRVDWNKRDTELVDRVIATAVQIKNSPGRPRRVTERSIGLKLGMHLFLRMHKARLPRTQSALKAHVESTEQIVLRRIHWAVEMLKMENRRVTKSEMMSVAGVGSRALCMPSVCGAIERAKADLECLYPSGHRQRTLPEPLKEL